MVKIKTYKYTGEIEHRDTGELLSPLVVAEYTRQMWYSTFLPNRLFADVNDACTVDLYMRTGKGAKEARCILEKEISP